MDNLFTFEEVLNMTKTKKRNLLLGNGFSMAYDSKRFSFTSLYKSAVREGIIEKDSEIHKIFEKFETSDFEVIIKTIESSAKINEVYSVEKTVIDKMKKHTDDLKEYLVDIITNNHPSNASIIADCKYDRTIDNFIRHFEEIYTLNYDLLLYWTIMHLKERKDNYSMDLDCHLNENDGFSPLDAVGEGIVKWQDSNYSFFNQKIFYLHGALHIFDDKYQIIKNVYDKEEKLTLREQTLINLKSEKYPIFISEGTSEQKLAKIIHNSYLNNCYKKFKTIEGVLIIFGTGLKANDDHILNAILTNNIKYQGTTNKKNPEVYLGVSDLSKISEYEHIKEKLNENGRKLLFFDYKTVDIW
ncbi:MAG: DUF4917 family protein [Halarcobacter sp.]